MITKQEASFLFQTVAQALDSMSAADYEQLLKGKGQLRFVAIDSQPMKAPKALPKSSVSSKPNATLQGLATQLRTIPTREAAQKLLKGVRNKAELGQLAELLQIPLNKNATRGLIEEKIIDFVVGDRLRAGVIERMEMDLGLGEH